MEQPEFMTYAEASDQGTMDTLLQHLWGAAMSPIFLYRLFIPHDHNLSI